MKAKFYFVVLTAILMSCNENELDYYFDLEPADDNIRPTWDIPSLDSLLHETIPDSSNADFFKISARKKYFRFPENSDVLGAKSDLDRVIQIDPNDPEAYHNLGCLNYDCGSYRTALEFFNQSYKIYSNYKNKNMSSIDEYLADYNLRREKESIGYVYYAMGEYDTAIFELSKALNHHSNFDIDKIYLIKGNCRFRMKDYTGSKKEYDNGCINSNRMIDFEYNYGLICIVKKDYEEAIKAFTKSMNGQSSPYYFNTYLNRASAKALVGDFRGAILDYDKFIEKNGGHAGAIFSRGKAKKEISDLNGACLDWSKAGELGHKDAYNMIEKYCQ